MAQILTAVLPISTQEKCFDTSVYWGLIKKKRCVGRTTSVQLCYYQVGSRTSTRKLLSEPLPVVRQKGVQTGRGRGVRSEGAGLQCRSGGGVRGRRRRKGG